jgi:hypothetical protein
MHDVVPNELEPRVIVQMDDIRFPPREEVVDADHIVPALDQPVTKMATEKSRSASNDHRCHLKHSPSGNPRKSVIAPNQF